MLDYQPGQKVENLEQQELTGIKRERDMNADEDVKIDLRK